MGKRKEYVVTVTYDKPPSREAIFAAYDLLFKDKPWVTKKQG